MNTKESKLRTKLANAKDIQQLELENVSIPPAIVDEIIKGIPNYIWDNPHIKICILTFKDPYLIYKIEDKFMAGLKNFIEDESDRLEYIRKNIIYGYVLEKGIQALMNTRLDSNNIQILPIEIQEGKNTKDNKIKKIQIENMPKFDFIIQNPPYKGSTHLDFFEAGLDMLSDKGQMIIIEPATWLINIRKDGKAKIYDKIKEKIKGHVKSVIIENFNNEFNTKSFAPFSITYIDNFRTFENIYFSCCGDQKIVKSLYDCNMIGNYKTLWNILDKIRSKLNDVMNNHTTNDKGISEKIYYAKYANLAPGGCLVGERVNVISLNSYFINDNFKHFIRRGCCDDEKITTSIPHQLNRQGQLTQKLSKSNIYGTKVELENWKYFNFNNKLPLFINIVFTIDQNNSSKNYLPWLVDKKYTDQQIYDLFSFTKDEIDLIENTIKKYKRDSPWLQRYFCGPESVSNEEVQKYLEEND